MNDVFLPFTYKTAQILPCATESELSEKIKESDFLISDAKCVHRMVGVKYNHKTMRRPKITFTAMRHEMILAKQIVFKLGKKIFYDGNFSASLFKYSAGDCIDKKYLQQLADYYRQFWHLSEPLCKTPKKDINQIDISEEGFYINGSLLKPPFKIQALIRILGEPDKKEWKRGDGKKVKIAEWHKWGLVANTDFGKKDVVCMVFIYMTKAQNRPGLLPFSGSVTISNSPVSFKNTNTFWIHNGKDNNIILKKVFCNISENSTDENIEVFAVTFAKKMTPFCIAVRDNNFEKVRSLIARGANVNRRCDFDMSTPLFFAANGNQIKMAELLLANGADVNAVNMFGDTPLMECIKSDGTKEMIQLLINAGADTSIKDRYGKTIFDIAKENGIQINWC